MEKLLTAEEAKKIASNTDVIEYLTGEICSRIRKSAQKGLQKLILKNSELSIDLSELNCSHIVGELKKLGYEVEVQYYNKDSLKPELKYLKILWL